MHEFQVACITATVEQLYWNIYWQTIVVEAVPHLELHLEDGFRPPS